MSPRVKVALGAFGVASLGAFAWVLSLFPQTAPVAPAVSAAQELARQGVANIPRECPAELCDGGRSLHQLDGGRCECL